MAGVERELWHVIYENFSVSNEFDREMTAFEKFRADQQLGTAGRNVNSSMPTVPDNDRRVVVDPNFAPARN